MFPTPEVSREVEDSPFVYRDPKDVQIKSPDYSADLESASSRAWRQRLRNAYGLVYARLIAIYYNFNVKTLSGKFSNFLKLYGESLQALVQGYREVTMDSTNSYKFGKDRNGEELTV